MSHRHDPQQLNQPGVPKDEFALEEIIREFSPKKKRAPQSKLSDDTMAFTPVTAQSRPPKPTDAQDTTVLPRIPDGKIYTKQPKQSEKKAAALTSDTMRLPDLKTLNAALAEQKRAAQAAPPENRTDARKAPMPQPEQPAVPAPAAQKPSAHQPDARRRRTRRIPNVSDSRPPHRAPAVPEPDPEPEPVDVRELFEAGRRRLPLLLIRVWLLAPVALLSVLLVLCRYFRWSFALWFADQTAVLSVILLGITMLLSYDACWRGLLDLLRLRISLFTLTLLASVLSVIYTLLGEQGTAVGSCCVVAVLWFFLMRAQRAERRGMYYTLRTVTAFDRPMGIFDTSALLKGTASLRRDVGDTEDFVRHLGQPDRAQRIFCLYSTLLLPASALTALLISERTRVEFLPAWLLLLLGAIPCAASLSYSRPFASVAKRLSGIGGALCGWHGAQILGGRHTLILRDEDLFPTDSISFNGMKLYGANTAGRTVAYVLAALEAAGNPLCGHFERLLQEQYGKRVALTSFRIYDDDGIGAEIQNDSVLVGSLPFMRSMGVHMPDGTRVRQAVYLSVNGELAGIFALKYKPNLSTRAGLLDVLSNRSFKVVLATRDFLITPELLAAKYELPTETILYPVFSERIRLSERDPSEKNEQGALIARNTFGAFASTAAAGRTLRITTLLDTVLGLSAGLIGVTVCAALLLWDAAQTATPLHLVSFQLLWAVVNDFTALVMLRL
ncbi:MAG: hypothetical protein SOX74_07580 [Candidatus Faecousia sp.]|uniref:hypothetical protein n=1 Tax=Faecousia sp. TaxID=2952921 RepID=UPI002A8D5A90|nr:hypothetical protein [Candidatus Faecousia sp.]